MIEAAIPDDEAARQRTLESLDVLDTSGDPVLDGLTRIAADIAGCPIALISLIDTRRQWFMSRVGLVATETPRDIAFCAHAILGDALFEVPDATLDVRFVDNPLVTEDPRVRFYAGVPLDVDGHKMGTLCVIDHQSRTLTEVQRQQLLDLGRLTQQWLKSRQEHRAARESEIDRRALFEQLGDGVMLVDPQYRVLEANAQAHAMLGYTRGELVGMRLQALLADFEHSRLVADGPPSQRHAEWEMVRRDGTPLATEVTVKGVGDRGYLSVIRDVTRRRLGEHQLRQLSLAVDQSLESILITDFEGRIQYVNDTTLAKSGYQRAELIGQHISFLKSDATPPATFDHLRTTLALGKPWDGVMYSRSKDGGQYTEQVRVSPVRLPDGRITSFLAVKEDVTEKRRMIEELDDHRVHLEETVAQRTAELALAKSSAESANRAKSDFLASMSHEIRTPMNGVVGIVEVLRKSRLDRQQGELVDTIRDSAFALLGIIDDILDFSKIEAGRLELEYEPVSLLRLAESVCDGLLPVASGRGVGLRVFVDPALPDWIVGDEVRLRQILNNLLGNAIKFSAGRDLAGRVWLRIEVDSQGALRIEVGDNGIGMSAEVQQRVFQPFAQAETSTTRRYGGSGLGLSICRRLVDMFGGRIALDSTPGAGSVFTVTLPLRADAQEPPLPRAQQLAGLACHLILSDPALARDWAAYLVAAGAEAECWEACPTLQQAIARSGAARTVVIVTATVGAPAIDALEDEAKRLRLPLIRVHPGTQRGGRIDGPGLVSLEGDAVRRDSLLEAVALATGRVRAARTALPAGLPIGEASSRVPVSAELILVAEDNDINRMVIRQQLALLGLNAEIAEDGIEALARWRRGRYALLLTDLHMPGMDGYELAATIRREEDGGRRMPIVALTANALRGEAERCLAAGMDDYLTKPVQLDRLGPVLARWLDVAADHPPAFEAPDASGTDEALPVLDDTTLAKLIGDDAATLAEVRRDFVVSARFTAEEMRDAVKHDEHATVGSLAHRLKSSARAIGALELGRWCERLEVADKAADGERLRRLLAGFEVALAALLDRMAPGDSASVAEPDRPAPAAPGVLLVDDEPFQLRLMERQLDKLGVGPVHACESATAALAWLDGRHTPALLVMVDLNMPGMDGVELIRHLAERRFAGAIALVSGADTRLLETGTKLAAAYQLNVLSYLHKPVQPDALRDLVARWRTFIPRDVQKQTKLYVARDLRRALDADELVLHYQPKVSLRDGTLLGVEALVRWQHPTDGLLYPDSFIGVAESGGLIDPLTVCVLSKAMAQSRRWRDAGLRLRMAVNISMRNLARLDFPEVVLAEVQRHGVAPGDVVLEVTESTLMQDSRAPLDILTRLRLKGIGLSIDDFGTGHSSLAQLRDIPFDELKIDRGFVHGNVDRPTQRAIFAASLEMAHQLKMNVVAEGVEDRTDWDFARDAGCDVAQGYFIARPMEGDALVAWAAAWRRRHLEICDA